MTVAELLIILNAIATDNNAVVEFLKQFSPSQEITSILNLEEFLVPLLASLASKGVQAYTAAANVDITPDSIQALMPDQTPLTPPTE